MTCASGVRVSAGVGSSNLCVSCGQVIGLCVISRGCKHKPCGGGGDGSGACSGGGAGGGGAVDGGMFIHEYGVTPPPRRTTQNLEGLEI